MNTIKSKFLFFIIVSVLSSNLYAVSETQIKAVFLEKFTRLIEWPTEEDKGFTVCVLNDKNFAEALKEIYKGKTFNKQKVHVLSLSKEVNIPKCHLLFIGKNTKNINSLVQSLGKRSILTVSDDKDNIPENVMITMFLSQNRFKYIINNKAAQKVNVKISYLLLKSAQEVIK